MSTSTTVTTAPTTATTTTTVEAPPDFPSSLSKLFDRPASSIPLVPKSPFDSAVTKEIKTLQRANQWSDSLTSALHLLNDDCTAAHDIVTDEEQDMGCNLVHAILHRREADFWNSKWWLSRITHPFLTEFYGGGSSAGGKSTQTARAEAKRFVDTVESLASGKGAAASACGARNLLADVKNRQEAELKGLVAYLWEQNNGKGT